MELKDFSPREQEIIKAITSQGFTINSGLGAVQLDELAKLAYNIFYPELKKVPHIGPEMYGQSVGAASFSWKSILNPNATGLPAAVSPGNRNAISSMITDEYSAPYCTLGFDQSVQDEEVEQERGFDDPLKNARIMTMHNILKSYDVLVTAGNRGPDSNGFALGTAATPILTTATSGGSLLDSTTYYVACVELTAYSMQPGVNGKAKTALTPLALRTPANASTQEAIPTGCGLPSSEGSHETGSGSNHNTITATQASPAAGAFGWAWFVNSSAGSPPEAGLLFAGVTSVPSIVIKSLPVGTQTLDAFKTLQDGVDTSYNGSDDGVYNSPAPEFDGAFAYIASQGGANFVQMAGAGWTADGFGGVQELEDAILAQYDLTQAVPDEIVCGVQAVRPISQAVLSGSTSNLRQLKDVGADGGVQASGYIRSYVLKFSPDGNQRIIPVSVSPNLPDNAVWMPTRTNPFPTTSATIPANMQLVERKKMYSENFAKTRRTWEIGTYVQTTLAVRAPEIGIVFAGANSVLNS